MQCKTKTKLNSNNKGSWSGYYTSCSFPQADISLYVKHYKEVCLKFKS